jgi:hypothetical protein
MPDPTIARAIGGAPQRPKPDDFRQQFIRLGWDVVDHYRTGWKVVDRWVEEEGRASLRADRKAYRQMQALKVRFEAIADARSPIVATDFVAAVAGIAQRSAARTSQLGC